MGSLCQGKFYNQMSEGTFTCERMFSCLFVFVSVCTLNCGSSERLVVLHVMRLRGGGVNKCG